MGLSNKKSRQIAVTAGVLLSTGLPLAAGCHDGPMYSLKKANPYFSMHQWPAAEKLGPTDHKRAEELRLLVSRMPNLPAEEQTRWVGELEKLMEHDKSPHMRCLAVQAAAGANPPSSLKIIEKGLQDDVTKVRMISAQSLQARDEPEATRLLVEAANSDTDKDVRLAAIKSLGGHQGDLVTDALKLALQEPDLAYRHYSIASLRQVTGRDVGDDPDAWMAMLENGPNETNQQSSPNSWGARLKSFF